MTAPNTTDTAPTTANTQAAPAAPAVELSNTSGPPSRVAARTAILQGVANEAAAHIAAETPAPGAAPTETNAPGAAPGAAPTATPDAPKPELELQPEAGPNAELGTVKVRFKDDATGQYLDSPPIPADKKFEIEVNGKRYVKDFPGVLRLAADGIAGARHANENHQIKTQVIPRYEQTLQSVQDQLDAQIALNREILGDEGRYAARRQEFLDLNSPEQRAARAERALEERDRQQATSDQTRQQTEYYQANILPTLTSVFADAPTVTNEEVLGKISLETGNLVEHGVIPPKHYPAFAQYLRDTLVPWATGLHASRSQADTARRASEQQAAADTERRRQAQLDTRTVGSALAPANPSTGAPVVGSIAPSNQPPAKSRDEARQRIREQVARGAGT